MVFLYDLYQQPTWAIVGLFLLAVWTIIWQGIALWHAAQHRQKGWFIAVLILNTFGLLPIIYLLWFKPRETEKGVRNVSVVEMKKHSGHGAGKKTKEVKRSRKKK